MRSAKRSLPYFAIDALLLRASVRSGSGEPLPVWPAEDAADAAVWVAWIGSVWSDPVLKTAVHDSSPELAERIEATLTGQNTSPRDGRRLAIALAKYMLRLESRATPFGLFAGVVPISFGPRTRAELQDETDQARRVDAKWLAGRISEAERDSAIAPGLVLAVNNMCRVQGKRLMVPGLPVIDDGERPAVTSLRLTTAVAFILRAARSPITWEDLAGKLAGEFPGTDPAVITRTLSDLLTGNVLISCLRPPAAATDPLEHVLGQLSAINPAYGAQLQGAAADAPRAVDVTLRGRVEVNEAVTRELEDAANALVRSCRRPHGSASWGEYLRRFYDHYGVGTLVPVAELIDAGTGLGLPDGYLGFTPELAPTRTKRDEVLLALAQAAALEGLAEIELTDDLLARLEPQDPLSVQVPAHLELAVRINALSSAALDQGEYTVGVLGVGRSAGAMTGRFLHLLEPANSERFSAAYAALPTIATDAIAAQLSFPSLYLRSDHVTRAKQVLPIAVSVGEFPAAGGDSIDVDDLAIGCDSRRLYLVSLSRNRPVEPYAFTALRFDTRTPPLARFLAEVSGSQGAIITGFDWGAAESLPYLPAVRRGRTILAPARWKLDHTELPPADSSYTGWVAALSTWRARRRVPTRVLMADADQHLCLDLDNRACAEVLCASLERAGRATLLGAPPVGADGWLGGRAHSIVVPLAARQPATWPSIRQPAAHRVLRRSDGHLPGASPWLYARLPVPAEGQDHVITEYLPQLLADLGTERRWWFMRYRETEPELRIRVALTDDNEFGPVAAVFSRWAASVKDTGLTRGFALDTYLPESGRWGSGSSLAAAEAVFHADSNAVVACLRAGRKLPRSAVIAAGFTAIAAGFLGSHREGSQWLVDHGRPSRPVHAVPRELLAETARLAGASGNGALLNASSAVHQAWQQRADSLAAYRSILGNEGAGPDAVLTSLLHVHHVRAFALDDEHEQLCLHLARATAQSFLHRNGNAAK